MWTQLHPDVDYQTLEDPGPHGLTSRKELDQMDGEERTLKKEKKKRKKRSFHFYRLGIEIRKKGFLNPLEGEKACPFPNYIKP